MLVSACGSKVVVENPTGCADGLTKCGGTCVDTDTEWQHCGECDQPCYEGTCVDGICEYIEECFEGTYCNGICTDTYYDPNNCGGCGFVCPSGICDSGFCIEDQCACGQICKTINVGSAVPQSLSANTFEWGDQWYSSCSVAAGPEAVFLFYPPQTAYYMFDTYGSGGDVDTVIEVLDQSCGFYGCNDIPGSSPVSLGVYLNAGMPTYIVVETPNQPGNVVLNINYGAMEECVTCGDFIMGVGSNLPLCPGSDALYDKLITCICNDKCAMQCNNACSGQDLDPNCQDCIFDEVNGCGVDFNACANDI